MEKASKNQQVINAIGEPVMKGPWYSASLSVAHKRGSASCTFPVSGPQGNGVLRLKAVRNGGQQDYYLFLFLVSNSWRKICENLDIHLTVTFEQFTVIGSANF